MVHQNTLTHLKRLSSTKVKSFTVLYEVLCKPTASLPRILVVEGYMDVVALAQYGVDYSVASLGTSTTGDHIQAAVPPNQYRRLLLRW